MMSSDLTQRLKEEALRLGFDRVGVAPAVAPPGYGHFQAWLEAGNDAGMSYLKRHEHIRSHPDHLLDGVRTVLMVSIVYGQPGPEPTSVAQGKVARYARGHDYHRVLWNRLEELLSWLRGECPQARGRVVVDTAPLLERDFARMAGLGWVGKNSMLIDRRLGSFTFLGALLLDLELTFDNPHIADHCGTCTRCLDACPTDAFAGPYELDSRKCISYWTIEHKGPIPEEYADQLHGWVFGCDVCQDVCPWNRKAPAGRAPEFDASPKWTNPDLIEWLDRDREAWKSSLAETALSRSKRSGLVRNATLVLGERGVTEAVVALQQRLADVDEDRAVRAAAAWALGRIGTDAANEALRKNQDADDQAVSEAVARAIAQTARKRELESGQAC
jgi:epoxyqueuosine reductase